ncbi:hypothetical protein NP233_g11940 [Leucocoprinus birnbaumii]|uniref:Uncharacterized protein n=1 Tax=Leucocoprinus birnbaumii TaxID=56174 RepID=A0AAD5VFD0_9AGAR|nr:hypothetical protein NP233_g11940 [Leucocoprinus birnbaumii]
MAPGNEIYPFLAPPFVNMQVLQDDGDRLNDRLVRVFCTLIHHDLTVATVKTTDGKDLRVFLPTAFSKAGEGKLKHVEFNGRTRQYVLEGIVKFHGWALLLTEQPRSVPDEDIIKVIDAAVAMTSALGWVDPKGFVPPDPRLTLEYDGINKPWIYQLLEDSVDVRPVLRATNQLVLLICPKHNPMAICDGQYASVTYKPLISSGVSRQNVRTCRAPIVRPLASWTELTGRHRRVPELTSLNESISAEVTRGDLRSFFAVFIVDLDTYPTKSKMPIGPPFVNKSILDVRGILNNCRVRVVCEIIEYDECTAIVETTDGEPLHVIFFKALPADFKFHAAYYLLEGITKENGSYLLVEEEPQPLLFPGSFTGTRAEMKKLLRQKKVREIWDVIDEITDYMHQPEWLMSAGTVLPDPRFEPVAMSALMDSPEEEEEETRSDENDASGIDEEMNPPASE